MKPTLEGVSVETSRDALILITAVMEGILDPVTSRPGLKEDWSVKHGDVYIFNQSKTNIKRWTDRLSWGPSRGSGLFFYYKRTEGPSRRKGRSRLNFYESFELEELIKKTIAAESVETGDIYYCISYYYMNRIHTLQTVDQIPAMRKLTHGEFIIQKKKEKLGDPKLKLAQEFPNHSVKVPHIAFDHDDEDCATSEMEPADEDCPNSYTSGNDLLFPITFFSSGFRPELNTSLTETLLASSDYFEDDAASQNSELKSKYKNNFINSYDIWLPGMAAEAEDDPTNWPWSEHLKGNATPVPVSLE